jgi:hypothetical protein
VSHSRRKHLPFGRTGRLFTLLALAACVATATVMIVASAGGAKQSQATVFKVDANHITAAAVPSAAKVVDVATLPDAARGPAVGKNQKARPLMSPLGAAGLKAAKAAAAANAPTASDVVAGSPSRPQTRTPGFSLLGIDGLKDSPTVCPPFGCQPPDMGLATSPKYVMQAVNTSVAVWQLGKKVKKKKQADLINFFGVPQPTPIGCADLPFMSDPRLAYDPETQRFYASALQVEGAFGVDPGCNFVSRYWVAVSKNSNPGGKWNVYAFNTANILSPPSAADYTQMGFNGEAIFIGGNQFNQAGTAYVGAWTLAIPKATAMAGGVIPSLSGFAGYTASDGTAVRLLDTVQPVISLGNGSGGPAGEILVSSFNESITESKVVVFDFSNALQQQATGQTLSGVVLSGTLPYSQPPLADNPPDCTDCLETIDNRISATPVYMHGMVYATHDTALNNGAATNANVHWMVIKPVLSQPASGCTLCTTITGATSLVHDEYLTYGGQSDTWFGAIQPDREGNIFLEFEFASTTFGYSPGGSYIARRATATGWPDTGACLSCVFGTATTNFRWGDYEAMSFDGWDTNNIWIATEYSDPTSGGDWGTHMDKVKYTSLAQS